MTILFIPFVIQAIVMFFDEFYFHQRRGLPKWERIGHPLDTLTALVCYIYIFLNPYSAYSLNIFIILATFSCLFITKDEFVHAKECSAFENWIHAILFLLHPLTFLCAALIWKENSSHIFLAIQPVIIFSFMIYQLLRWSIPWQLQSK